MFSLKSVQIDISGHLAALRSDALWRAAAEAWHRIYYPYIPYDTGRLADEVRVEPKRVEHTAPYAAAVYNGRGAGSGCGHALASAHWDRRADPAQLAVEIQRLLREGVR